MLFPRTKASFSLFAFPIPSLSFQENYQSSNWKCLVFKRYFHARIDLFFASREKWHFHSVWENLETKFSPSSGNRTRVKLTKIHLSGQESFEAWIRKRCIRYWVPYTSGCFKKLCIFGSFLLTFHVLVYLSQDMGQI